MTELIDTRTIDTGGVATTTIVQKDACEIHWISISVETKDTKGSVKIYDGVDAQGKLKWQSEPAYEEHCPFSPPITCDQGCCVVVDANIACYTIGYRPLGWAAQER